MAFSMHSHSGQFCPGHAKDSLEEIIEQAIALKMQVFALTEHMPRIEDKDLYPEEIEAGHTIAVLRPRHKAYIHEAVRLREKYRSSIRILIGFEGEWIRPSYASLIHELATHPDVDFFVGSVHHVHEIPIDFDRAMYLDAREAAGGTDQRLFEDYFDAQYEMLRTTKPLVVAHFDLIRLFSDVPDRDFMQDKNLASLVARNLRLMVELGALMEVNSSALRKGLKEPYPGRSICEHFLRMDGRFTLSDDSHGVAQVGLNFNRTLMYLNEIGVKDLYYPNRSIQGAGEKWASQQTFTSLMLTDLNVTNYPVT